MWEVEPNHVPVNFPSSLDEQIKASSLSREPRRKAAVRLVTGSTVLHEEAGLGNGVLVPHSMGVQRSADTKVTSAKLRLIHTPTADATLALRPHCSYSKVHTRLQHPCRDGGRLVATIAT